MVRFSEVRSFAEGFIISNTRCYILFYSQLRIIMDSEIDICTERMNHFDSLCLVATDLKQFAFYRQCANFWRDRFNALVDAMMND